MGVIVKERWPTAASRLGTTTRPSPNARVLDAESARLGTTPDALALAVVMSQPWADVVLSGAATAEQLGSNLGALSVVPDERAFEALAPLAEPPGAYWEIRCACLGTKWGCGKIDG